MTRKLKLHWIFWLVLTLAVATGTTAFHLSRTAVKVELPLLPNASADVSMFHLLPASLSLTLDFERKDQDLRPLGNYKERGDGFDKSGVLDFAEPGAVVKIQVSIGESGSNHVFEALPAGSFGRDDIGREMVPYIDDGDPHRFQWPPAPRPILPMGASNLRITVLEVGEPLLGQRVTLFVLPPVSFESAMPGYSVLWWFYLWPVFAFALLVYASALLWMGYRSYEDPK
jgi:hypothetical protein